MAFKVGRCLVPAILKEKGMIQQDLADRLFMSPQQVSDYCTNRKKMELETAKAFAHTLGCHIDDLYDWIEFTPSRTKRIRRP